jgi:mutator protein MutT
MTHRIAVGALVGPLGVLMCHRRASLKWYPGKWDFPGGHLEDGETAAEALARELLEEVNISIAIPAGPPTFTVHNNAGATDGLALEGWVLTEWSGVPANLAGMSTTKSCGSRLATPANSTSPTLPTPTYCG